MPRFSMLLAFAILCGVFSLTGCGGGEEKPSSCGSHDQCIPETIVLVLEKKDKTQDINWSLPDLQTCISEGKSKMAGNPGWFLSFSCREIPKPN